MQKSTEKHDKNSSGKNESYIVQQFLLEKKSINEIINEGT